MADKHISHHPATSATIKWVNPFLAVGLFFINPIIAASNAVFYLLIMYDIQQTESKSFPLSAFIAQYTAAGLALTACTFLPQTYALFITPFVLFSYLISNILFIGKPAACNTTKLHNSVSSASLELNTNGRPGTPYVKDNTARTFRQHSSLFAIPSTPRVGNQAVSPFRLLNQTDVEQISPFVEMLLQQAVDNVVETVTSQKP